MLKKQVKQRRRAERGAEAALILRRAPFAAEAGRRLPPLPWNGSGAGVREPGGGAVNSGLVDKASFCVIII